MTPTNPIIEATKAGVSCSKAAAAAPECDTVKPAPTAGTTTDPTAAAAEPKSTANPVRANGQPIKKSAAKPGRVSALLRLPLLLSGEDKADYDALLAAVARVVKPDDVVDHMLTSDAVYHEWNLLRLRRLSADLY
jgi:hypothetical protein